MTFATPPPTLLTEIARSTENNRIGVALGAYGLIHAGTIRFLSSARARCDILFAAILPDAELPQENSQAAALLRPDERQRILSEIETVHGAAFFDLTAAETWRQAAPEAVWYFDPSENDIAPAVIDALKNSAIRHGAIETSDTAAPTCTTKEILKRIAR